jgi:hypothetical protein
MARSTGTTLARPGDAPAVPLANDAKNPVPTGIYENTGGEKTPQPPFTVQFFVFFGGFFRQCTVHKNVKNRRSPCVLCASLSFSGVRGVNTLCTLRLLKKKAKNRKYPHKKYTQRRSTKANFACALPQSTVDCETVHSV